MVDLYNTESGLAESVPDDELEDAYLSGTHFLKADNDVNLIAPDTSTRVVPPTKVAELLQAGWSFERKEQQALREFRAEKQDGGLLSSLGTFGKQAANQALLGLPEFVADRVQDPLEVEKREIEKEENPISNIAGGLSGFALSILYGGPIWKAAGWAGDTAAQTVLNAAKTLGPKAAESIAAKSGAAIAKGAAEGAFVSAPFAIAEAELGDHETVAEGILAGAELLGTGAALGGVVGGLSSPISAALRFGTSKVTPEKLEALGDRMTLKQAGAKTPEFRAFQKAAGERRINEAGEKEIVTPEMANKAAADFTRKMDFKATDSAQTNFEKILTKKEEWEEAMNGVRAKADELVPNAVNPDDAMKALDGVIKSHQTTLGKETGSFNDAKVVKGIIQDNLAAKLNASGLENLSLKEAHLIKTQINEVIKTRGGWEKASDGLKDAYQVWNEKIFSTLDAIANKETGASLKPELKTANAAYSEIMKYEKPFRDIANRMNANNMIGPTDYKLATVGAIFGDLAGAVIGGGLNYLKRNYSNKLVASTLYGTASLLDKVQTETYQSIDKALGLIKTKTPALKIASVGMLAGHSGDSKKTRVENFQSLGRELSAFATDNINSGQILSALTSQLSTEAPAIQQAMMQKIGNTINYLNQEIPKPEAASDPLRPDIFIPSDRQLSQFERKMQVAFDPMSVLKEIRQGTLTREHVDALKVLYPKLLEHIKLRLSERIPLAQGKIPSKVQSTIRMLMGDEALVQKSRSSIKMLQENFESTAKPKPRANSKITESSRTASDLDRIIYE